MNSSKQKDIFLRGEGDAWFERNRQSIQNREFGVHDPIVAAIVRCQEAISGTGSKLLEVGCGEGKRLSWISQNLGLECHGIDPSGRAVAAAREEGIQAVVGTADEIPYIDQTFDFLIFGFCLYLCDRDDLFRIAQEADRVLKPDAWLVIQDFYSETRVKREYHHRNGVYSFKMDYRSLFVWHPAYTCFAHEIIHHGKNDFTDDPNEWVGISVLRKKTLS